jgi:haloacetate dehalogenase
MSELIPGVPGRVVEAAGVRFLLHRADPPRKRRTTPALLLHGVPETAGAWRHLVPELRRDRIVLAPDLKGLGGSEVKPPYDVATLVAELAALVRGQVDGPVDVVGHDWGGSLALALAGAEPGLVRRLIVVNAPYRRVDPVRAAHIPFFALPVLPELALAAGGDALWRRAFAYAWKADRPLDPEALEEYLQAYRPAPRREAMLGYYRAVTRPRLARALQAMTRREPRVPAPPSAIRAERRLVLWGALDPVLPLAVGEAAVRDLGAGTEFVSLPGVGHFPVEEAPEVAVPVIAAFLRDGEKPAAPPRRKAAQAAESADDAKA